MNPDIHLKNYDYILPEEQVAQFPPEERGQSRLMIMDRKNNTVAHAMFADLAAYLPQGALLVANNTRVAPARLVGKRPTGGKMEMLILTPPPLLEREAGLGEDGWKEAEATVLLKPGKNATVGQQLAFGETLGAEVRVKENFGRHRVRLYWQGDLRIILEAQGHIPLPPYIKREEHAEDGLRYQTIYARSDKSGSVAAPTAGLHFTPELRSRLVEQGFGWEEVTLHVGYGTFSPVREDDIRNHVMHAEYVEISSGTAAAIAVAKADGRPVIAVGTTSARSLEGAALAHGGIFPESGFEGWTDIFLYPGYAFHVVDGLITNFHLPKSSLLMLVSALTGRERLLSAYSEARKAGYRFFSYGDAMLIR